jgi:pimeloyl-ACP methyl ester carboxylesterase
MLGKNDVFRSKPDASALVVMLHGFDGSPRQFLEIGERAVAPALGATDLLVPLLPYHRTSCTVPIEDIVADVAQRIEHLWVRRLETAGKPYDSVVLLGFSMGSQLVRAIFVHAWGADGALAPAAGDPRQPRYAWAPAIKRIVLLAGLNRGISVDAPLAGRIRLWWNLVHMLGSVR